MAKGSSSGLGSFSGFDIESIEKGLGLLTPESGDSGVKAKIEETDDPQKEKIKDLPIDFGMKIQIPESEEEAKQLGYIIDEKDEKDIGEVAEKKGDKDQKDKDLGGEDALITEDSPLYLHAATLHEDGILPTLDLESLKGKKHSEALQLYLDAQKKYIEEGRDAYKNSLSSRGKEFLELLEKGIPEVQVEHQLTIEDTYSKVTDEVLADDETLMEQLIIQNYRLKGLTDKKIQGIIKLAKDEERLFEESKESRDDITKYLADQKQKMIANAEEQEHKAEEKEQELQNKIKLTIDSIDEIFPGIKISAIEKTKLLNYMTKPVEEKIVNGQKVPVSLIGKTHSADPINFNLRLNYFIEQGLFKKDFDLSKLSTKIKSSAASKLSEKLRDDIGTASGQGIRVEKSTENRPSKIIFPNY